MQPSWAHSVTVFPRNIIAFIRFDHGSLEAQPTTQQIYNLSLRGR